MKTSLADLVQEKYPDVIIKTLKNGDSNLTNFPIHGIHARLKPGSSGVIVFAFHQFNLLDIDYIYFEKYISKKLSQSSFEMVHFWESGNCIYVYVTKQEYQHNDFYFEVFNYIVAEINLAMKEIKENIIAFLSGAKT